MTVGDGSFGLVVVGSGDGEAGGAVVVGGVEVGRVVVGRVVGRVVAGGLAVVVVGAAVVVGVAGTVWPGSGMVAVAAGVVAGTLSDTDGVTSVGTSDDGSSLGSSLGSADGGVTTTPSPQVRAAPLAGVGAPATVTEPVERVTALGSTAYQDWPALRTSPSVRCTTRESGR